MSRLAVALLLAACGVSSSTRATALEIPAETQARWPGCTLDGWTLERVPAPFTPPAHTWCGVTYCTGPVRGYTNTTHRRIVVVDGQPTVLVWETCNACRWEQTRVLQDTGCA